MWQEESTHCSSLWKTRQGNSLSACFQNIRNIKKEDLIMGKFCLTPKGVPKEQQKGEKFYGKGK